MRRRFVSFFLFLSLGKVKVLTVMTSFKSVAIADNINSSTNFNSNNNDFD